MWVVGHVGLHAFQGKNVRGMVRPLTCRRAGGGIGLYVLEGYSYWRPWAISSGVPISAFRPSKSIIRSLKGAWSGACAGWRSSPAACAPRRGRCRRGRSRCESRAAAALARSGWVSCRLRPCWPTAGCGGQSAGRLRPSVPGCARPAWNTRCTPSDGFTVVVCGASTVRCPVNKTFIESASLNLKYPFGLSLSKPCAALRQAQRERFK